MPITLGADIEIDVSIGVSIGDTPDPSDETPAPSEDAATPKPNVENSATFRLLWKYTSAPICISINGVKFDFPMNEEVTAPAYVEEVAMAVTGVIFEKVE